MPTERGNDLKAFTSFAHQKLSDGDASLTLDDALCLWDVENQTERERDATHGAIARASRTWRPAASAPRGRRSPRFDGNTAFPNSHELSGRVDRACSPGPRPAEGAESGTQLERRTLGSRVGSIVGSAVRTVFLGPDGPHSGPYEGRPNVNRSSFS